MPHPDDIHNVYVRWSEEEVEVVNEEAEEVDVEVVVTTAILDKEGKIETPAVVEVVKRKPMTTVKVWKWIVQVNKSITMASGTGGNGSKTSKRAITIYKREGLALESKGNYPSASKACEALGLTIGGDSATRVLARESYIVEPFTGNLDS